MKNKIWLISLLLFGVLITSFLSVDAGTIQFRVESTGEEYIQEYVPEEITTFNFMEEPFQLIISEESDKVTFVDVYDEDLLVEGENLKLSEDYPGYDLSDLEGYTFLHHFNLPHDTAVIEIEDIDLFYNQTSFGVWTGGNHYYYDDQDFVPEEITTFNFMANSFQLIYSIENNEITFVDIYDEDDLIEGGLIEGSSISYHVGDEIDFLYYFGDVAEAITIEEINVGITPLHQTLSIGQQISGVTLISIDLNGEKCAMEYENPLTVYTINKGQVKTMDDGTRIGVTDVIATSVGLDDYCEFIIYPVEGSGGLSSTGGSLGTPVKVPTYKVYSTLDNKGDESAKLTQDIDEESVVKINEISKGLNEIKEDGFSVYTTMDITLENNKLFIGGKEIKIMPKKLKEKINNIEKVELELVEEEPVYFVEHKEDYKLFGVIPIEPTLTTQVSAEDEEILKEEKPTWLILAKKQ